MTKEKEIEAGVIVPAYDINEKAIEEYYKKWVGKLCLFWNIPLLPTGIGFLSSFVFFEAFGRFEFVCEINECGPIRYSYCALLTPENLELLKEGKLECFEKEKDILLSNNIKRYTINYNAYLSQSKQS